MNSRTEVYHVPQFDGPTSLQGMTRRLQEILDKASAAAFYRSFMDFTFKPHENRSNFDQFAAKLNGEANRWFHEAFSVHLRNRVKPFDSLVNLFQVRYMIPDEGVILLALQDVHTLLSEHASAISQLRWWVKAVHTLNSMQWKVSGISQSLRFYIPIQKPGSAFDVHHFCRLEWTLCIFFLCFIVHTTTTLRQ